MANDYKIRLDNGEYAEINSAEFTDRVDADFETSLGEYGVVRNPETNQTWLGAIPGDGGYVAFGWQDISLEDVKEILDDMDDGFFGFIGVEPNEYINNLTNEHLANAIMDIQFYNGYFNTNAYTEAPNFEGEAIVAMEESIQEALKTKATNAKKVMFDDLGNPVTPEEWAKGVADGTINEDMKTVKEHLADRLKELGWENLDKSGVEKEIKKLEKKGWYDKYTLDMTLLYHLKEFGNDLTESFNEADALQDEKALALIDYLVNEEGNDEEQITKSISKIDDSNYSTPAGDYYVFPSYDDAVQAAVEYEIQLLDDVGIGAINWQYMPFSMGHYVDLRWFDDAMRESNEAYIEDIKDEEGRLEDEMAHAGVATEEEYLDYLNNLYTDSLQWYIEDFGEDSAIEIIDQSNLADMDLIAQDVVETDGPANALASYDGNEVEHVFNGTRYYIYRN